MIDTESFDYIVVGAGTAGALLAARLASGGRASVLVLEAGPADRSLWIHLPVGFFKSLANPAINWGFQAAFDEAGTARQVSWPRGKVVGGSGSINGLVYIRGQRADFDVWGAQASGWGWDSVERSFQAVEQNGFGPAQPGWRHRLCDDFIAAAQAAGYPARGDLVQPDAAAAGYFQLSVAKGLRNTTARTFLHPARRRGEVELRTEALVERVEFAEGRACAVVYQRGGQAQRAAARREVVLCAGAIGSPQLLQLSGIGPGALLRDAGIAVLRDSPQVGRNLQDHYALRTVSRVKGLRTLNELSRSPLSKAAMALRFALTRSGPLTIGAAMAGLFACVEDPGGRPDVQLLMGPLSVAGPGQGLHGFAGMTSTACQLRPESRGFVAIRSPDTRQAPRIVANYLVAERDRRVMLAALRLARRISATAPLADHLSGEMLPGPAYHADDELLDYIRGNGGSIYHPVGSCAMGDDPARPLDATLRVRGVAGLRVADASVMPTLVSSNSNAACAMIGERAAALIAAAT